MDHDTESCLNVQNNWSMPDILAWKSAMYRALQTFGMKNKEFQFLLKPFTAKIKVIIHKGTETQASRMLVDIVLQDVAMQLSEVQYATFCHIYDSLMRAVVNRPHAKYRPAKSVYEEPVSWWRYVYNSVLDYYIKPYTWSHIAEHRRKYKKYKNACIQSLQRPNDTELKLDLQKYEDNLTILNIVIAREHARQELRNRDIEQECQMSSMNNIIGETVLSSKDQVQNTPEQYNKEDRKSISVTNNLSDSKIIKSEVQIDYKLNLTLANCCLSLLSKGKEMLIVTVTQFLTSIETRPTLSAFKVSVRAESLVIEAISIEGDLVPLITVDNVLTGNVSTYFLAIDFEKNGLNVDPIFEISIKLETIEVTYHQFAMVEIINFFKFNTSYIHETVLRACKLWNCVKKKYLSFIDDVLSQTLRISFKIDIKSPYIIFPEYGSLQKGGHILILDLGNVTLTNELQTMNLQLEDATLMELEELLYDRLNVVFSGGQILFCHSGDDWRMARKRSDSEYHLLPKLQVNATLSYSIRPEYRQLPRTKLNIHISNMKFNLTENKLRLMTYFLNKLLTFYENNVGKYKAAIKSSTEWKSSIVFTSVKKLLEIQSSVCLSSVTILHNDFKSVVKQVVTNSVPKLDRSVVSSEVSEEDLELLSKTINLSGFDDNISPCNHINLLLRFAIGEFSINLEHTVDNRDQPYLNLRLHTLYYETAMMEYGVAVQFGIGSILLVDKTNAGVTGSYLELISTDESHEVLIVSYRKVKSNCPDFKSHFKNIERLLIVNLLNININFHRSALLKIKNQWHKFEDICHCTLLSKFIEKIYNNVTKREQQDVDPPIPPGAIKLNYSTRLSSLVLRFCDKDIDLIEIKILGFENNCIYNANERMVLRAHLRSIFAEDLNDDTLYSKILTTDEDNVFDLKYVRHTPKLYRCSDIDTKQDDVMSDGTFKLSVGRINCVIISKLMYDLQNFVRPFTSVCYIRLLKYLETKFVKGIEVFKRSATKLHIFIDVQGPTFLLPQKKDAPSLLVLDTGILSVENFFKNSKQPASQSIKTAGNDGNPLIIDNILIKLKSMTISRAIMTLTRDLEVQEPIIEPIQIQFDIKRKTEFRSIIDFQTYGLFNVQGAIDIVNVNLSQKDLKSLISVWQDNISKIPLFKKFDENDDRISAQDSQKFVKSDDDVMVKKLENFLTRSETALCEINVKLTLEGLQLNLFMDTEEVLSSPVRDLNHGLCKLSFGETINTWDFYSDRSLKMKLSLQNCSMQDTRKNSITEKKIIQSPAISLEKNFESCISVSMSPIVDVTYSRTQAEEKCFDVLIQDVRINLSVLFLMNLARYFLDSLPGEQIEKGIINHGYDNNNQTNRNTLNTEIDKLSRSKFHFKEQPGTSISIRVQKPDIFLFGDLEKSNTHVIRLQAEAFVESSRHSCSSSIVYILTNVNIKTKGQGNYESPCWLLRPCDMEICKKKELSDGSEEVSVTINNVNIHLSAEVLHTFTDIVTEASTFLNNLNSKMNNGNINQNVNVHNNLWIPMKVSSIPYKKEEANSEQCSYHNDRVIFNLKPVLVCLLLEMEYSVGRFPIMKVETVITTTINDWYNNFNLESNIKLYAFCYNITHQKWEPFVELCTKDDVNYKPWELMIKTYRGETNIINSNWTDHCHHIKQDSGKTKKKDMKHDGQDVTDMIFVEPDADTILLTRNKGSEMYITYEDESDTDDDENDTKLARISNYLFNNSSDDEESDDSDNSSTNEELELTPDYNSEAHNSFLRTPAKTTLSTPHIVLYTEDKINITITQNMITAWNAILSAFTQAKGGIPFVPINTRELTVLNDIGHASRVELLVQEQVGEKNVTHVVTAHNFHDSNSPISVPGSPENEIQSNLTSPQWTVKETTTLMPECKIFSTDSPVHIYKSITNELLRIVFEEFEDVLIYCPKKETCNLVSLRPVKHEVRYYLIIEASIKNHLHRTICVRSPLQFRNETSYALGLYYKKAVLDKLGLTLTGETTNPFDDNVRIAIVEPDVTYNVPLYVAYHCPIHILPTYPEQYQVSNVGIYWRDLKGNTFKDVCCETKGDFNRNVFCVRAVCTEIPLTTRPSGCQVPNYLINIMPPVAFNNQLPFVIDVSIPDINYEVKIEPGEKINMHSLNCNSNLQFIFKVFNYLGTSWIGAVKLNMNLERKFVLMSTDNESDLTKPFLLCLELCKMLSWNIILQSQYWIINKTGLPLFIQDCHSHTSYEMPEEELMVFSQKNKKSMVRVRAHQSEWSMSFGLDGITSMSLIVCRDVERCRKYQILTEIESSRLSPIFTKIITFLPYFFIFNNTKRALRFMEENEEADLWNDLLPGQEISFWPATEHMKMRIKWRNSQVVSQHFDITHVGKTVLRMDNGSALCVEIEGGVSTPYRVMFRKYVIGDIPVRVDNLCDKLFLKLNQVGLGQVVLLKPFQSLQYTWDDPVQPRKLIWNVYNNNAVGYEAQFETDGCGHEKVSCVTVERCDSASFSVISTSLANAKSWSEDTKEIVSQFSTTESEPKQVLEHVRQDEVEVYWVSYMNGEQRVLLFTQHESIYLKAKSVIDPEISKREIFLSIAAIGVSVIVQESSLHQARRELLYASVIDSAAHWELYFSKRWRSLSLELSAWLENKYTNFAKKVQLENFIDVDLMKMQMTKPFFGKLRRTYSPGIWLHCRESTMLRYLQGYVHKIQIDNQLNEATFPVVLYPSLQKTFVNHAGNRRLKHCLEFSCLNQRKLESTIYKGICIIVREFNLNLEETFLCSLINLIPKIPETKHTIAAKLRRDVSNMHVTSVHKISNNVNNRKKDIIEQIYISPMVVRLKLLANTDGTRSFSNVLDYHNVLRFIFEYAEKGTFEKDAEFRLPGYQKSFIIVNNEQFFMRLLRTYVALIMEQFHVLVRLTTVLGNQYGYNFKLLESSFCESDLLLLYGDEIAEKLAYDVACKLGYVTPDSMQPTILNNYDHHTFRSKIKDTIYQNPDVPPLAFVINDLFATEIELETSGLITTSTNSIYREGLQYFFKTLGKKVSTLFKEENCSLKAHSKVVTDIIKRAQEVRHNFVSRVRLPRYINPQFGVEPFSTHKAKGMYLLNTISKGQYVHNDSYWGHAVVHNDGKYITLISLQRLHYIEKGSAWSSWNVKWTLETNQLLSPPTIAKNKLILHITEPQTEEKTLSMVDWYVESEAADILEWLCRKVNSAMIFNMESSICSK
ncbi:vacuolar protein sorting-associated protein 13A-like isoform X2 [Pseudomyrmex gracilis]|nr:vacuolar protein sorting-associated protein 13A-like isoform X2 [Pseudomyrmex gracilis]